MKKNIIIAVLSTLVVVFIILLIVGIVSDSQENKIVETFETREMFKEAFMEGCTEGETELIPYCTCAIDKLLKEYTLAELVNIEKKMDNDGDMPLKVLDLILECIE